MVPVQDIPFGKKRKFTYGREVVFAKKRVVLITTPIKGNTFLNTTEVWQKGKK